MSTVRTDVREGRLRRKLGDAPRSVSRSRATAADCIGLAVIVGLFGIVASLFAGVQTLWLDETTQMAGIGLGPIGVTQWLAGARHVFEWAVAPDRMPPLSYYYHQAWGVVVGKGEISLRWSGIVCGVATIALTHAIGRRVYRTSVAIVGASVMGLAPGVTERAVEIRAYPLYLLLATAALYAAVRHVQSEKRVRWLILATVLASTALWTHFQGLVYAVALIFALAVHHRIERRSLVAPLAALGAIGAAFVALTPFISNSLDVSRRGPHFTVSDNLISFGDLCYNLVSHRINLDVPLLLVVASAGALLAIAASVCAHFAAAGRVHPVTRLLLCLAGTYLLTVLAASLMVRSFRPAIFQYNLPLVPSLAILFGLTVAADQLMWRRLALSGVAMLIACQCVGSARLVLEGQRVAHGLDGRIVQRIERLGVDSVIVIHEAGSNGEDSQVYYPLAYFVGGRLRQYVHDQTRDCFCLREDKKPTPPASIEVPHLIVVRVGLHNPFHNRPNAPMESGLAVQTLSTSSNWRLVESFTYEAYFKMTTWVFDRVKVPTARVAAQPQRNRMSSPMVFVASPYETSAETQVPLHRALSRLP